jgi:hypothetical protein
MRDNILTDATAMTFQRKNAVDPAPAPEPETLPELKVSVQRSEVKSKAVKDYIASYLKSREAKVVD